MYFKPCFYMVIKHSGGSTRIVYELQAHLIFLYAHHGNKEYTNKPI